MRRRDFLKTVAVSGLAAQISTIIYPVQGKEKQSEPGHLPKRPLGKTGEYLSIIGLGGMVLVNVPQETANKIVKDSIETGVNYFDVAPSYGRGDAESKLGVALEPYRKKVFLACKSTERTKDGIIKEMNESFKRLKTDYFDLYQLHSLTTPEDIKVAFGENGALEAIEKAKKDGLVRYIGFSAHTVESAMEALENYDFDSILFPINFTMWYKGNFGPQVVEYAKSKGAGVLAIKSMAFSVLQKGEKRQFPNCWYQPLSTEEEASLGLRFTLSQPVTAAVPPGDEKLYRMALKLAPSFIPLSEKEKDILKQKAENVQPVFQYPSHEYDIIKG
jgi:aryl-alcohol dehydrogenase-like predicted oxidoreductase